MKLITPMQITAADSDSRTITGRIVAFNELANASSGKVTFARGSIVAQDVFLNLEHDRTRRIGKSCWHPGLLYRCTNWLIDDIRQRPNGSTNTFRFFAFAADEFNRRKVINAGFHAKHTACGV